MTKTKEIQIEKIKDKQIKEIKDILCEYDEEIWGMFCSFERSERGSEDEEIALEYLNRLEEIIANKIYNKLMEK